MNEKQTKNAKKQFNNFKEKASEEDIKKIDSKLGGMNKGALKDVWDKVILLWKLIKDPKAAWGSKAIAIGALLYVISPIDAIPDFIPILGLTDDAGVIAIAVASLGAALKEYSEK
jgi:uncharacterized membrane protein YkvA (DUF1232 family)